MTAVPKPRQQANPSLQSPQLPKVATLSPQLTENTTVSIGLERLHVPSVLTAPTSMDVVSATRMGMAQAPAINEPDPRIVVTPLIADRVEELLCKYNLLDDWMHILIGIRNGFDVGVRSHPPSTRLFRKSCLFPTKPFIHRFLHRQRAGRRPLFPGLCTRRTRTNHRTVHILTSRSSAKATLEQIPPHSRFIIPSRRPIMGICQCWNQCRRLPYGMGFVRQYCRIDPLLTTWLCCRNVRHLGSLPHHPCAARPTKLLVRFLAGDSLRGQSPNVWLDIQCRGFRIHRGHACRHLWPSRFRPHPKMGGRFSRDTSPTPALDRSRFHSLNSILRRPMESRKAPPVRISPTLHWIRLELGFENGIHPTRKTHQNSGVSNSLAQSWCKIFGRGCKQPPRKTYSHFLCLSNDSTFLASIVHLCIYISVTSCKTVSPNRPYQRPLLGFRAVVLTSKRNSFVFAASVRYRMVGRRQHVIRHWRGNWPVLGSMAVVTRLSCWPTPRFRYWLGRSRCCRIRAPHGLAPWLVVANL